MSQEDCTSETEMDEDMEDEDPNYYDSDNDIEHTDPSLSDPEYFEYTCLPIEEIEKLLNESVEIVSRSLSITPSLAKILLHSQEWSVQNVIAAYKKDSNRLLIDKKIKPPSPHCSGGLLSHTSRTSAVCNVCYADVPKSQLCSVDCSHEFCKSCWTSYFEVRITEGISTSIQCMQDCCDIIIPEDFVVSLLSKPAFREKYRRFAFADYVKSHPQLRFCPGPNCEIVVKSVKGPLPKRASCTHCKTSFCFKCGTDYHAPTDCDTVKLWLTKCADDSETANYISGNTKDCPQCHICIEKNGGCNHMQCYKCKYDFCWMCLQSWKAHGSEYYECSRYKENPNIAQESAHAKARAALKKYLHYYERWENHSKSLKLEKATMDGIKSRIHERVMNNDGTTWIDWQYLLRGGELLAKCRYTLQYTYPYAYYLGPGMHKEIFEMLQGHLEHEIEELSWKIENADKEEHRKAIESQMDIVEKRRIALLKDVLDVKMGMDS